MKLLTRLCVLFLLLVSCGCAGRATTFLEYYPPENVKQTQTDTGMSIVLTGKPERVKGLLQQRMHKLGFSQIAEAGDESSLVFVQRLPEELLQSSLDCGRLSTYTEEVAPAPLIFPVLQQSQNFFLADGTSQPKPATWVSAGFAQVSLSFLAEGNAKTSIAIQIKYLVNLDLHRYVMISGFSLAAPVRISEKITEEDHFEFMSHEIGRPQKPLPGFRYQLRGSWPVQCASSGTFENWLLKEIQKP